MLELLWEVGKGSGLYFFLKKVEFAVHWAKKLDQPVLSPNLFQFSDTKNDKEFERRGISYPSQNPNSMNS